MSCADAEEVAILKGRVTSLESSMESMTHEFAVMRSKYERLTDRTDLLSLSTFCTYLAVGDKFFRGALRRAGFTTIEGQPTPMALAGNFLVLKVKVDDLKFKKAELRQWGLDENMKSQPIRRIKSTLYLTRRGCARIQGLLQDTEFIKEVNTLLDYKRELVEKKTGTGRKGSNARV